MKIAVGADHAGYRLKETLREELRRRGCEVVDRGTGSEDSVDYPDFAEAVARSVGGGECERGVLVCGTGIGMAITANKVRGVRAAVCHDVRTAEMSRRHNDANVLCLGARVVEPACAVEMLRAWLETPFEGGRHERRVEKIRRLDSR